MLNWIEGMVGVGRGIVGGCGEEAHELLLSWSAPEGRAIVDS